MMSSPRRLNFSSSTPTSYRRGFSHLPAGITTLTLVLHIYLLLRVIAHMPPIASLADYIEVLSFDDLENWNDKVGMSPALQLVQICVSCDLSF